MGVKNRVAAKICNDYVRLQGENVELLPITEWKKQEIRGITSQTKK